MCSPSNVDPHRDLIKTPAPLIYIIRVLIIKTLIKKGKTFFGLYVTFLASLYLSFFFFVFLIFLPNLLVLRWLLVLIKIRSRQEKGRKKIGQKEILVRKKDSFHTPSDSWCAPLFTMYVGVPTKILTPFPHQFLRPHQPISCFISK